jgi:hypothetical protein
MLLKHFKKHENHCKHTQHPDKMLTTYVRNIYNIPINTITTYVKNTDETLETDACNIRVQPLQHMQYLNLFLQHPSETLATYL